MEIPIFHNRASVPSTCGGLRLTDIEIYDDPDLGVSMRYQGPSSMHADAYLYNLGITTMPVDLQSPEVIQFYEHACHDVQHYAALGYYLELETVTSQYLHIPPNNINPFCLWAAFKYRQPLGPNILYNGLLLSHLTLRIDHGFINNIRYTYPDTEDLSELGFKGFIVFLTEWTSIIQKLSTEGMH